MKQHRAKPRSTLRYLIDRLVTRVQRLPAPTSSYTVERDIRISMRDGVELLTDIYTPTGPVSGTMLTLSPYGWNLVMSSLTGGVYASRGYRMILARCRGTFGSGGTFDPLRNEINDGADTVEWMRGQTLVRGTLCQLRGFLPGLYPVEPSDRPAAGTGHCGHLHRAPRLS